MSTDLLAEISGIKPKRYLKDGEQVEVQSKSSSVLYQLRVWVPNSDTEAKQKWQVRCEACRRSLLLQMPCKQITWVIYQLYSLTRASRDGRLQAGLSQSTRALAST